MSWTKNQIQQHVHAAENLAMIAKEIPTYIRQSRNVTEYSAQRYILMRFRELGMRTAVQLPIVAFGASGDDMHYMPREKNSRTLRKNTLIMIDMWAALKEPKAPYADMTWMFYYGDAPTQQMDAVWDVVRSSRDTAVKYIQNTLSSGEMPVGHVVDGIARMVIKEAGYGDAFVHSLGHSLGTTSPHGRGPHLLQKPGAQKLKTNIGYTIEPGIYLKNRFGIRSEIDFYISNQKKLVITTPVQRTITLIET